MVEREQLARMLPRMPDKKLADLIATGSMVQRTAYIERVMALELSACMPKGRQQHDVDVGKPA